MSGGIARALVYDKHEHRVLYATSPSFHAAIDQFAATLAVSVDGIAAAAKEQDAMFEKMARQGLWDMEFHRRHVGLGEDSPRD